jgi:hypothetical protein
MRFKIGKYNFEFYNVRKHAPVVAGIDWLEWGGTRGVRPFAECDLMSAEKMITDRMAHVVYHSEIEFQTIDALFRLITENRLFILRQFMEEGRVGFDISDPFRPWVVGMQGCEDRRYDPRDCEVVWIVDDVYKAAGKTRLQFLRSHLDMLDTVNDSDLNLIYNYGAMGILSPENSARTDGYLDDEGREEIQKEYHKRYGVRFGRWAMLITKQPVKFQRIDLPIKELELNDKRKAAMASVLQFMNIPKELHAYFDNATYANRNEAELDMYTNCVSAWAALFTESAHRCYEQIRINSKKIQYPAKNDFWFDIVGVPALQEAQQKEKEKAREELKMWRELRTEMPEKSELIDKRINDLIESL